MARIEWIRLRLNNWALWKIRGQSGGLGWATQAAFLNDEPTGGYRESRIPIDDVDAAVTDQAVESLQGPQQHLYDMLQCMYIMGLGVRGTARQTGKGESTVKAHLDQADHALRQWFNARAERQASALLQK
jgi:hypothetical protein